MKGAECPTKQKRNGKQSRMNGHAKRVQSKTLFDTKANSNTPKNHRRKKRRPIPKPHETEEEAIIRRFHDAQRMARFRAKKKKALEEAKSREASKLAEMAVISELKRRNITFQIANSIMTVPSPESYPVEQPVHNPQGVVLSIPEQSKYSQLLAVIEELGKDVRLTYAGSKTAAERIKLGIVQARMLIRDCLLETELNLRQ